MADVFTPSHPHGSLGLASGSPPLSTQQKRRVPSPQPIPPFVFPSFMESGSSQDQVPQTMVISHDDSRRSLNRNRRQLSINALPAFDFGDSASSSTGPSPSPTRSSAGKTPPPSHASGHRRGVSEFVGGDVSNPITAGSSPVKGSESSLPLAVSGGLGPPTSRRGHAHRRSGAVSQHDLSMILKSQAESKAGSAPNTPSHMDFPRPSPPCLDRSLSQPAIANYNVDDLGMPPKEIDQSRARVTFSGEHEYIAPRPLSTISSETSSSVSTIRQTHSINDSITSIVSGVTSSPPPTKSQRSTVDLKDIERDRPTKRGEPMGRRAPPTRNPSWPNLESGVQSLRPSASTKLGQNKEIYRPVSSPHSVPDLRASQSENQSNLQPLSTDMPRSTGSPRAFENLYQSPEFEDCSNGYKAGSGNDSTLKDGKRQKKTWGSRLSRKSKQQVYCTEASTYRPPTPPTSAPDEDFSLDDITFDEDTTCIIETPQSNFSRSSWAQSTSAEWNPRYSGSSFEGESSMLDIDAALNAPYEGEATPSSTIAKRRMHSSGETGGFSGPGMHYHRRAESAPEMDFFEQSRLGFPRGGSNPAMAEAIKEEEEEEEEVEDKEATKAGNAGRGVNQAVEHDEDQHEEEPGLGVNIVETDYVQEIPVQRRSRRSVAMRDQLRPDDRSTTWQEQHYDADPVEIVGADEEPRFSVITKSSDESTITPTVSPAPLAQRSVLGPLESSPQTPNLSLPETASTVSSPDCRAPSIDSHDAVRVHTANSSITDRATLSSSRAGDHRLGSVDDVPSLTSSASTMISGHPTRFSSSTNTTTSADRALSLSEAVPARTRLGSSSKRSSLASLSRLVGSSQNKSKLNIAELAPADTPERLEKKKGKRISRLMFWKSKDKLYQS